MTRRKSATDEPPTGQLSPDQASLWNLWLELRTEGGSSLRKDEDRVARRSTRVIRVRMSLALAIAAVAVLTPFGINNILQGRTALAIGSFSIIFALAANAWFILRGRSIEWIIPLVATPAIVTFLVMCFRQQGLIATFWTFPAVITFHTTLSPRRAQIASVLTLAVIFPEAFRVLTPQEAVRFMVTVVMVCVFATIFVCLLNGQQRRMRELMVTDPLTGVGNRMVLDRALELAARQSHRSGIPATLIALDLDDFKSINDSLGHDHGDTVLRSVGDILRGRLRGSDQAFRLGGEEFLVLLSGAEPASGRDVAEKLRLEIESLDVLPDRRVTASFGVADLRPGEMWRTWLRRTDRLLYKSKGQGKNRISCGAPVRPWGSHLACRTVNAPAGGLTLPPARTQGKVFDQADVLPDSKPSVKIGVSTHV